jgi:hypothetical protein
MAQFLPFGRAKKKRVEALMEWARAVINGGIGQAGLDYWQLSDIEHTALAYASQGKKTEAEEAAQERQNQIKLAAELRAAFPTTQPKPPQ